VHFWGTCVQKIAAQWQLPREKSWMAAGKIGIWHSTADTVKTILPAAHFLSKKLPAALFFSQKNIAYGAYFS